jgi:hypothetical protein
LKVFKFFLILIIPFATFSQSPKKLKRRTYANQYYDLTEKGHIQTETFFYMENNIEKANNYYIPDFRLRYGLQEDLEIFTDIDLLYNNGQKIGIVPLNFGLKVNVTEEKKHFPDIAFITGLQFGKIGTENFQVGKILPQIGLIFNKQVTDKLNLEFDCFLQWIDDNTCQTQILDLNAIYQLNRKISISTGVNYYTDETTNNNFLIDYGITYQKESIAYSIEFGHKLYSNNLNYFIGLGIIKTFINLK